MQHQTLTHFSAPTKILHWLTAVLVLVAFIYGLGGSEERVYSTARDFDRQLHETLGLAVLALVVLRMLWRVVDDRPAPLSAIAWLNRSARVVQVALYVLLFAVPVTAIVGAWLEGHALTLLAGVAIRPPMGQSHALGAKIAEVHTWLGDAVVWLAGAHAGAALFHHYILKDGVLRSMLPHRNADPPVRPEAVRATEGKNG